MIDHPDGLPPGFRPISDPGPHLRIKASEEFREGRTGIYKGVTFIAGKNGKQYRCHWFESDEGGSTEPFAVWPVSVLDRLLAQVKPGERVFLRYDGLESHPSFPEKTINRWVVARG